VSRVRVARRTCFHLIPLHEVSTMNGIIYIIGLIVVVLAVLSLLGLR
jgi:hypothetical protein